MADQGKSAFGFDQTVVDKWDARETGVALGQLLGRIGKMSRTSGNIEQIRDAIVSDPDALAGLEHVKTALRETAPGGSARFSG